MTVVLAVFASFALVLGLALGHAGPSSWIQGLNYLVAGFPLAFSILALAKARATKDARARRMFVYYFALAAGTLVYGWNDVERHRAELRAREITAVLELERGESEHARKRGFVVETGEVGFRHSITRRHILDRATGRWRDEDVGSD